MSQIKENLSLPSENKSVIQLENTIKPRKRKGGWIVLAIVCGFFIWGSLVPLSKGVVAQGTVVVDSKRKTVQHLEGGIIKAIHVREGSQVNKGDAILELEDTRVRAERDRIRVRFLGKLAALDRLKAQANNESEINFSQALTSDATDPVASELMQLQQNMLKAFNLEYENKKLIAQQRIKQLQYKLAGINSYQTTLKRQITLLDEEILRLQSLLEKKLVNSSVITERFQQLSQQQGELGKTIADVAETKSAINEAKLNLLQINRQRQQELARELSETREDFIELESQLKAAESVLSRTVLKAPITGKILGLKATTVGGVLTTADPVTDIVPENDTLVVDARVGPLDIDSVKKGLKTHVKFTSFASRTTPDLLGIVDYVSADTIADSNDGSPYYLMRVTVPSEEIKKLHDLVIVPGMPAEVYVDGGSRTMLEYLLEPISSLFRKSLRES